MNAYFKNIYTALMAIIAFSLFSPAFGFPWNSAPQNEIQWGDNLRQALELSRQTGRPVLLHFFSDTCPPCKMMEKSTFPNPAIAETVQNSFIPVKLNVRQFPREAQMFNVQGVPMDIVLSPDAQQIQAAVGGQDANRYREILATAVAASKPYMAKYNSDNAPKYNSDNDRVGTVVVSGSQNQASKNPYENRELGAAVCEAPPAIGYCAEPEMDYSANPPQGNGNDSLFVAEQEIGNDASPRVNSPAVPNASPSAPPSSPMPDFPAISTPESWAPRNPSLAASPKIEAGGACPIHETPSFNYDSIPDEEKAKIEYEGYCPVELGLHSMWVRGDYNLRLEYGGRLYLFAGKAQMEEFKRNPKKYVPAFNGNDPVVWKERGVVVHGSRVYGAWAVGRVFLFSSEENLIKFEKRPSDYIPENMKKSGGMRR